jgi:colicin import membrane protein
MADIIIGPDESKEQVARELLDQAEHPDHVIWRPRSNTPHGGVFEVPDDEVEALVARREAAQQASQQLVQDRLDRAAERDDLASRTGLTPAELGFPANGPEDTASIGQVGGETPEVDPLRSPEQQLMEREARVDGVAEAQDAQVARAQERAEDAEAADADAEADEDADAKAAADRAAARKAARRTSSKAASKSDAETSDKE